MQSDVNLLQQTSVEEFLRCHFHIAPIFIPGALPNFVSPLSPDELAGLACEEHVESRLVTHTRDVDTSGKRIKRPYRLSHGPFDPGVFASLGDEAWTLLVQDVDKFVPEVHALLELVSFLPRWSVDDIMISYAAPGGSVGPHTDRYDVFLLQAQGTRRWQVSTKVDEARLRPDTDLRVLAEFEPEEEFIARPGDVLYLPPGVAHFGVAEDECMTYSFGFRAPTEALLVSHFADEMSAEAGEGQLKERLEGVPAHPSRLSPELLETARHMVRARFEALMKSERSLGRYLTMPKPHVGPEAREEPPTGEEVRSQLAQGAALERNISSRFLFAEEEGEVVLFVDGQDFTVGRGDHASRFALLLCEGTPAELAASSVSDDVLSHLALVTELVARGALLLAE